MGTRASFWIGNPMDLDNRQWLGCIGWDGYMGSKTEPLSHATNEEEFKEAVQAIEGGCDDFTNPKENGFPFPWVDDLFLTDYTYAFFDGQVQVAYFHNGFIAYHEVTAHEEFNFDNLPFLPKNVPTGTPYDRKGKDSIMILLASKQRGK